jgi:hypothetical protein
MRVIGRINISQRLIVALSHSTSGSFSVCFCDWARGAGGAKEFKRFSTCSQTFATQVALASSFRKVNCNNIKASTPTADCEIPHTRHDAWPHLTFTRTAYLSSRSPPPRADPSVSVQRACVLDAGVLQVVGARIIIFIVIIIISSLLSHKRRTNV